MPDVYLTYYSHLLIQNTKDSSVKLASNFITEDASDERKKILDFIAAKKYVSVSSTTDGTSSEVMLYGKEDAVVEPFETNLAGKIENTVSREEFFENFKIAQDYIEKGEICQIILGNRKKIKTKAKAIDIYCEIRKINPSPYMFFWERGGYSLIGNSPELQLKIENQHMEIRPIGGTSKGKGNNEAERKKTA
jgi:anthranilate/para-aminobenzoate synthase component I